MTGSVAYQKCVLQRIFNSVVSCKRKVIPNLRTHSSFSAISINMAQNHFPDIISIRSSKCLQEIQNWKKVEERTEQTRWVSKLSFISCEKRLV
jgi:hypothetical protein